MYKKISSNTRKVTPKECKHFLAINNFPGQRRLNPEKARHYSELNIQGGLRPVGIDVATIPGGERVLMNGQHVCQGCIWSDRDMDANITFWKCETLSDAWQLFATFDVHQCRTQSHIFQAARGTFSNPELREVPLRILQTAGTALGIANSKPVNFRMFDKNKSTKVKLVEVHSEEVIWLSTFADTSEMIRVGAFAAMLVTRRKDKHAAESFWRKVQSGVGYASKHDHEKKVRDMLFSWSGNGKLGKNGYYQHEGLYSSCICWWNSWRKGEPRTAVKLAAQKEVPNVA